MVTIPNNHEPGSLLRLGLRMDQNFALQKQKGCFGGSHGGVHVHTSFPQYLIHLAKLAKTVHVGYCCKELQIPVLFLT